MAFQYHMPTKLFVGKNIIRENKDVFAKMGKKAFIITGKSSSKKNGSFNDVVKVLDEFCITYAVFDEIEENPSVASVERAAEKGINENVDFIIGIGGGSSMDAAKAIAILTKNPQCNGSDLYKSKPLEYFPVIQIPTTAGTGSETTPYSILTLHEKQTKQGIAQKVFAEYAFLDAGYMLEMPRDITINTGVDALTHFIESYLCVRANLMSDCICEVGFLSFAELRQPLMDFSLDFKKREQLLLFSSLAGICISQTATSLPHGMGYALTYFKNAPHGLANGILTAEYLRICNAEKVNKMLNFMGFDSIDNFKEYLLKILNISFTITQSELDKYAEAFFENKSKLQAHPNHITLEQIKEIYYNSFEVKQIGGM